MNDSLRLLIILTVGLLVHTKLVSAETVGVFADTSVGQIQFAAGDVVTALQTKGFVVESLPLASLSAGYANKKIVIALAGNTAAENLRHAQGGTSPGSLAEQAYSLQTTDVNGVRSYWIFGGDKNGAMYGGLQIAEYVNFDGFSKTYTENESPHLKLRGIKFNIPWDQRSQTYFNNFEGTAHQEALRLVWDMNFWKTWFDEMARHRYNALSLWSNHPFTSLVEVKDYEYMALQKVFGFKPGAYDVDDQLINNMSIAEKTKFWQDVMKYGNDRGFSIYLMTWNIFLRGQIDKAAMKTKGLTEDMWNQKTKDYMRLSTIKLLETFPLLNGLGVTVGENMGDLNLNGDEASDKDKSQWAYDAYGLGMKQFAEKPENANRKLTFIHRSWMAELSDIQSVFQPLQNLPNVVVDVSYKYAIGHAHAAPKPGYWESHNMSQECRDNGFKSWLTIRNDDYYYLHWADPGFVQEFINGYPKEFVDATYVGADGWTFSNNFNTKNTYYHGGEAVKPYAIQKTWMMQKLWGRIGYNPKSADTNLFKNHISFAYKIDSSKTNYLYDAWTMASRANCRVGELVTGDWNIDQDYWPEAWTDHEDDSDRFLTLNLMPDGKSPEKFNPPPGSAYANMYDSAQGNDLKGKISALENIKLIESQSQNALSQLAMFKATHVVGASNDQKELGFLLKDIEALAYLAQYGANKLNARYALWEKSGTDATRKAKARDFMGKAYAYWKKYTSIMDANYVGAHMQRNAALSSWTQHDAAALKEFTDLGGPSATGSLVTITQPTDLSAINQSSTITAEVNVSISGRTINKVELWRNGSVLISSDNSAPYQFTLSGLALGAHRLEARVFDSGNAISYGIANVAVVSSTPTSTIPPKPTVDSDTSPTPTLSGKTTNNALITIYKNGIKIATAMANGTGDWSYKITSPLSVGTHLFTVSSTAPGASESGQSPSTSVTVSGTIPASKTPTAAPGTTSTTSSTPTLSGANVAVGAKITIYDGNTKIGETTADSNGNWTFTVSPPLGAGAHNLSFTVTETGKSESGKSPTVTISVSGTGNMSIKINFQPTTAPKVTGYEVDDGKLFGINATQGRKYGWSSDLSSATRDRNHIQSNGDQLKDTLILTQKIQLSSLKWEIELPNGTYNVRVVAGDPGYFGSDMNYAFLAEGGVILNQKPSSANRWVEDTDPVVVNDGRLTIENGSMAVRNRLCFIEISLISGVSN